MSTATTSDARVQAAPTLEPKLSSALRYAATGVDVDANDRLIPRYRRLAAAASRPELAGEIGGFSGAFDLSGYERPTLVASTDGVGTKVMVATLAGRLDGVGRDLVNHCINDLLPAGAEPLFFLDYLACNGLGEEQKAAVVAGIATACREGGLALLGGETADMADLYPAGEFDLAGTIVGVIEGGGMLDREPIAAGDAAIGLPSNGLHTNGYSLAREALGLRARDPNARRAHLSAHADELGEPLADALLRPHRSYLADLRPQLPRIKALAHVTGGGIAGNLERALPEGLGAELDARSWAAEAPPIFGLIRRRGGISIGEMFRVFNMGVGMIAIAAPEHAEALLAGVHGAVRIGAIAPAGGRAGADRVHISHMEAAG